MAAPILWTLSGPTPMVVDTLFSVQLWGLYPKVKTKSDFREKILHDTFVPFFQMATGNCNCYASIKRKENFVKLHI